MDFFWEWLRRLVDLWHAVVILVVVCAAVAGWLGLRRFWSVGNGKVRTWRPGQARAVCVIAYNGKQVLMVKRRKKGGDPLSWYFPSGHLAETEVANYGLLTDDGGCPVAVSVHPGNTSDATTFMPQVTRLREQFGVRRMVMVGDRGMISQKAIDEMSTDTDVAWISALRSSAIRVLVTQQHLQLDLFDERNLLEISSPEFPGERLVACRNPELAKLRAHTRNDLLLATEKNLENIKVRVDSAKLVGKDKIGVAVGKVVNQYKVAKHFELTIADGAFGFARIADNIAAEAALDGLYIIRTSVAASRMDAPSCVRAYKSLSQVERAFRSIKTMDLKVRPIHHHLETRVRAHIFLCMLAYYVEWHLRQAWRELTFADEDQAASRTRDPVAPARRSAAALKKAQSHTLEDGTPTHSFQSLMAELAAVVQNTCRAPNSAPDSPTFQITTTPNNTQKRALDLIAQINV